RAGKLKCETLRTDPEIFDVWSAFVVAAEKLAAFSPAISSGADSAERQRTAQGVELVRCGKDLVFYITRARVPMPRSTRESTERLEQYRQGYLLAAPSRASAAQDSGTYSNQSKSAGDAPPLMAAAYMPK